MTSHLLTVDDRLDLIVILLADFVKSAPELTRKSSIAEIILMMLNDDQSVEFKARLERLVTTKTSA